MKRLLSFALSFLMLSPTFVLAAPVVKTKPVVKQTTVKSLEIQATQQAAQKPARSISLAFVFDGQSDKNKPVLETFKQVITKSLLPNYNAVFNDKDVFVGDWTEHGAKMASDKALNSQATIVISLGYMSSVYLSEKKDKKKYVVTIDQYGLRDFGQGFFNPIQQSANDFVIFKTLFPKQTKTAILINENFYKTQKDWKPIIAKKFAEKKLDINFEVIPVSTNVQASLAKMPSDTNAVFITPMFNLSTDQRKELYTSLNAKKLPTFSSAGKDDVELGALLGTSAIDADKKLAQATSFNIHGVLGGKAAPSEKIAFFEDPVIYLNVDTAETLGYDAPLRLLNNAEIVTAKTPQMYDLSYIMNTLDSGNLDIQRQKYLVKAARRAAISAGMRYLPTLRLELGYQNYNQDYARSYNNVPLNAAQWTTAIDQVLYSPDLVTNILIKKKRLNFQKSEEKMVTQNIGLEMALLYLDCLTIENAMKIKEEYVKDTRENLAMARVREKMGLGGKEEILRWAGMLSISEQELLNMRADYKNIKIHINKILYKDQKENFVLAPLKANDPALYTSELHVIDHVRTPEKLAKFTELLIEESIKVAPETAKLKTAIEMKKTEMANYMQKFVLPDAKMSFEWGNMFNRNLPYEGTALMPKPPYSPLTYDTTSARLFIGAQWKPIEGGHKFAEIARCKAELDELNAYLLQVNTEIEQHVRETINKALAKYFTIEKNYKAMFAEGENYQLVKAKYLGGKAPIAQVIDAQNLYMDTKLATVNSQYDFFKELVWVQRALVSVNWQKATPEAKTWIQNIPKVLPAEDDFKL